MHGRPGVKRREPVNSALSRTVWIVEDEPAAATLAVELCASADAVATTFSSPVPYLAALRGPSPPSAVVFDWRLEHELSAALFLATRHRFPDMRVVYWTGSPPDSLPEMVRGDHHARIIDKAAGSAAFEAALGWALSGRDEP